MAEDPLKKEVADVIEFSLRQEFTDTKDSRMVLRSDYRTLVLRIPVDGGPTRDFQVQVKEMY